MSHRRDRGQRGQGLAEFALIFPIFILLLLVVFDFGRAIYAYHTISNAARSGARVAIVDQQFTRIRAAVMEATVGVNPNDISPPTMSTPCVTIKIGCEATVTVTYSFRALTPVVGNILGPMTIRSTTQFPIERVYSSPP